MQITKIYSMFLNIKIEDKMLIQVQIKDHLDPHIQAHRHQSCVYIFVVTVMFLFFGHVFLPQTQYFNMSC